MTFFKLYLISLVVFFAFDLFWLSLTVKNLYKHELGSLMSDEFRWGPAILFYCLYVAGLVFFALLPVLNEGNWTLALIYGGFFGLVCYATYDLTNLATIKGWPLKLVVYDLLWGTFISGVTCLSTFFISHHWKSYFS